MTPEDIEARLKSIQQKIKPKALKAAVEGLPDDLVRVGRVINGRNPKNGKKLQQTWYGRGMEKRQEAEAEAAETLEKLSPKKRAEVFKVFTGELAPLAEEAWQWLRFQPYTTGWGRKAFRSPSNPKAVRMARFEWFERLARICSEYDLKPDRLMEAVPLLGYQASNLVEIFAAQIDAGSTFGEAALENFVRIVMDDSSAHEMGEHVIQVLLKANRGEGWEAIEKLLLAAQRQEGLRQSIVDAVDLANPKAFLRMVRLILDENLIRFSSVARGIDVWFSLEWDAQSVKAFREILERCVGHLTDEESAMKAALSDDAEAAYFGLWALGFYDIEKAVPIAGKLMKDERAEHRFVAVYFLGQASTPEGRLHALAGLSDEHPAIVRASLWATSDDGSENLIEPLRGQLERYSQKKVIAEPLVWPWTGGALELSSLADLLVSNFGSESVMSVVDQKGRMSPHGRGTLATKLAKECQKNRGSDQYLELLDLARDRSSDVVNEVFGRLRKIQIDERGSEVVESLLTRKAANFRRSAMRLILGQDDEACVHAVGRLISAKNVAQRLGGLEVAIKLVEKDRSKVKVMEVVREFQATHKKPSKDETALFELILDRDKEKHTFTNALGLADSEKLPVVKLPQRHPIQRRSEAGDELIKDLDRWIDKRAEREVEVKVYYSETTEIVLFGEANYRLPRFDVKLSMEQNIAKMPFGRELVDWFTDQLSSHRDEDGLQLLRAVIFAEHLESEQEYSWGKKKTAKIDGAKITHLEMVNYLLAWLFAANPLTSEQHGILIDYASTEAAEYADARLCKEGYQKKKSPWISDCGAYTWLGYLMPLTLSDENFEKYFDLKRWLWRPAVEQDGQLWSLAEVFRDDYLGALDLMGALEHGLIDDNEVLFSLLGAAHEAGEIVFETFISVTERKLNEEYWDHPQYSRLRALADKVKRRVIEVELERGDLKQLTSATASQIGKVEGISYFIRFAVTLGNDNLVRQYQYGEESYAKNSIFSDLLRATHPGLDETAEDFCTLAMESGLPKERFVDLAMFAPHWAAMVEAFIGWPGFEDAVCWIHAHTRDDQWQVSEEVRNIWNAKVAERTPLSSSDLIDGAVDVAWFQRLYAQLKKARWNVVLKAAKFASSSGGHKRAELFASAMLKEVTKRVVVKRIKDKRHQDSVRALGLLPLAKGATGEKDAASRYALLKEFLRQSRQFGSQRQASEKRCVQIGIENLARTAGYADPVRLEWAMESKAVEDLRSGSVTLEVEDVAITLLIDALGEPQIKVARSDKELKAVPAKLKKKPEVKKFTARKTTLKKQLSRMRLSLEEMMCHRDAFTGAELQGLVNHPLLANFLKGLVFSCEGGFGYLAKGGKALSDYDGKLSPVAASDRVMIVHPWDLYERGDWEKWQHHCFRSELIQPFKQIFRELYPVSEAERSDVGHRSARYAGHQVNPRQAMALLGGRGWLAVPGEGVRKVFHKEKLCAWIDFEEYFYTPGEVEDLTLASVYFYPTDEAKLVPLEKVPSHLFSECMRDLDLVVSVAHSGGVDPEATQSTVEMRRTLAEETCRMMGLKNVTFEKNHALIQGSLAKYSIHLGSTLVHLLPGKAIFLVAVQSQHRGRIFLPFADKDPKTAELLSKVIMLARDERIKDPSILAQLK